MNKWLLTLIVAIAVLLTSIAALTFTASSNLSKSSQKKTYHPNCKGHMIPDTPHWVCTEKRALESLLIGSLRDLRVRWYKSRAKDKTLPAELRSWYNITQGALKVILNASYGVFGADSFDLYCPPVAEATAAIGRYSITKSFFNMNFFHTEKCVADIA